MKKFIYGIVLLLTLFFITGCENRMDSDISFIEDYNHDIMTGVTYKFTGKSEHFGFQTGKVYYTDIDREILISNFKQIKEIGRVNSYSVNVYFNNNSLFTNEKKEIGTEGIESYLEKIVIGQSGKVNDIESDVFTITNKDNFKDSIKVVIEYCYKNSCKEEIMKLTYIDEE